MKHTEPSRIAVVDASLFSMPYDIHFCRGLSDNGCDVTLFCRRSRVQEGSFPADIRTHQCFYRLSESGRLGTGKLFKLTKLVEHFLGMCWLTIHVLWRRYAVIHFQWAPLPIVDNVFLRLLTSLGKKVVFTAHNDNPFHGAATSRIQSLGWERTLTIATTIQVHTHKTFRSLIAKGVPEEKIFVAPHGAIELSIDGNLAAEFKQQVDQFLDPDKKSLLVFGWLKKYKGIDLLMDELLLLAPEDRSRIQLILAGRAAPDMEDTLAREIDGVAQLQLLRFLDQAEIEYLLQRADVVAFPYREIDASGALMLAMNHGCCCLVSKLEGFTEVIQSDSVGIVFDHQQTGDLATKLHELLNKDCHRDIGREAQAFLSQNYSWQGIGRKVSEAYAAA